VLLRLARLRIVITIATDWDQWARSSIDRTPALCWCKRATYVKLFTFRAVFEFFRCKPGADRSGKRLPLEAVA
jgi:hypothetical protein